jgi:hypothetical protein
VCWLSTYQGRCNFLFLTLVLHSSINVCCESIICWVNTTLLNSQEGLWVYF